MRVCGNVSLRAFRVALTATVLIGSGAAASGGRMPGDVNGDEAVDNSDIIALVEYVNGGVVPALPANGDVDGNCCINTDDVLYLQEYLFAGGPSLRCDCPDPALYLIGDLNCDHIIDNSDVIALLAVLNGDASPCVPAQADVNGDCCLNQEDVDHLQSYLFSGGPPPANCTCLQPRKNHPGDVNCDGAIDLSDMSALSDMLASGMEFPGCNRENADTNGDSCVTQSDLDLLADFLFAGGPAPVECAPHKPVFPVTHTPGDANSDGQIDLADGIYLLQYLEGANPAPSPLANGDANGDCCINLDDVDYINDYVTMGGPRPPECTCRRPLTVCGDADGSGTVNVADVTCLIANIFSCTTLSCMSDADGNQRDNINDVTYLIKYIFADAPPPKC